MFRFLRSLHNLSIVIVLAYIATSRAWVFLFSHILTNVVGGVLDDNHSNRGEMAWF
jgi:hypothetical protein